MTVGRIYTRPANHRRGVDHIFTTRKRTVSGDLIVEHHRFTDPEEAARERDRVLAQPNAEEQTYA